MLCETRWGVEADPSSIVIDSPIPQTRCAPDLTFYLLGENNRPITSAAHVFASIEVKIVFGLVPKIIRLRANAKRNLEARIQNQHALKHAYSKY